jgi:hypothetical protein
MWITVENSLHSAQHTLLAVTIIIQHNLDAEQRYIWQIISLCAWDGILITGIVRGFQVAGLKGKGGSNSRYKYA